MTPVDALIIAGGALYGARWRRAVARDAGVPEHHVRHWLSGQRELPADHPVFSVLMEKIEGRRRDLTSASGILHTWKVKMGA